MTHPKILLVDDAAATRDFIANNVLAPEGYEVITAASGTEGLQRVRDHHPDLIISDYLMPDITGLDFLQSLKQEGFNTPFILITAEGSEMIAVRALRLGVRDYLMKPFDIDELLNSIQNLLKDSLRLTLHDIFDQVNSIILITDDKNRLLFYNQAACLHLNIPPQTQVGTPIKEVIKVPDFAAVFEQNPPENTRWEVALENGRIFNAELAIREGIGRIVVMQDITHLKELDRLKSEFVTTVSRDLRSPLTTILGYLDLMGKGGSLNMQQQTYMQHIIFSVKSITALLSDLLDLSKIEAGYDINLEPTSMEMIVRYALEAQRTELENKKQAIKTDLGVNLPQIRGNPIRLKQMAINLLQNAIKYTPEGGEIEVRLYADQQVVVFEVQDNGMGISVEDQPHIWDKFYRADAAVERYSGTGLGLSIVKSIVDTHKGRVWVKSAPGEGSCFTVMLESINGTGS